jgi:hypothetical protein
MPGLWKATMAVLVACLLASLVIGAVKLATTPQEIIGGVYAKDDVWHRSSLRR